MSMHKNDYILIILLLQLPASKIRDGSIGKADVSTAFIKKVTIPDQNLGYEWDPDNSRGAFTISDPDVKDSSVMSITLFPNYLHIECVGYRYTEYGRGVGYLVTIGCNIALPDGTTLSYVVTN